MFIIYYALTDSISSMDPSPKDSSCYRVCPVSGDSMYAYGHLAMCAYVHLQHVPSRQ